MPQNKTTVIDGQKVEIDTDWLVICLFFIIGIAFIPKKTYNQKELLIALIFIVSALITLIKKWKTKNPR